MLLVGEVAGDDKTMTVFPGQDQVGSRMGKVPSEQQRGIGDIDSVSVRGIHMVSGHTNAVACLERGLVNHFALPPRPHPSANECRPRVRLARRSPYRGPQCPTRRASMRHSAGYRKIIVNRG